MAQTGRSPIAVQRWGRPSMPATRSWQARDGFVVGAELRRTRVAAIARAHVAKGADMQRFGVGGHVASFTSADGAGATFEDK
eukprot:6193382-Pleurochrysis_carterae.AAC.1